MHMVAASSRPDSPPPDGLRAALNGATSAIAEYSAASCRCATAAKDCTAAADKFVAAANAYVVSFAELEIAIVQFKAAVECAANAPTGDAKAMYGVATGFYKTTLKAHEVIVKTSKAAEEAMTSYDAKNKTLCAEAAAFGSKGDIARNKMAAFDAKLKESRRGLTKREVAALRNEAAAGAHGEDSKARVAIAEQLVASKALELVEKKCDGIVAMRDAVQADMKAVISRMEGVFARHAGRG